MLKYFTFKIKKISNMNKKNFNDKLNICYSFFKSEY